MAEPTTTIPQTPLPPDTSSNTPNSSGNNAGSFLPRPRSTNANSPSINSKPIKSHRLLSRNTSRDQLPSLKDAQDAPQATIDPLSRHIIKRTNTQNIIPQGLMASPSVDNTPGASEDFSGRTLVNSPAEGASITRTDSLGKLGSAQKDKKKGPSFLSRIIGTKKKDTTPEVHDDVSEISEARPTGEEAELFTQSIGYIPRFPPAPRYIKVRAQNTPKKEFDRVFLAQILNDGGAIKRTRSAESRAGSVASAANLNGGNTNAIWAMEFSRDGKYLSAAGQDKIVRVWSVISTQDDRQSHERQEEVKAKQQDGVKLSAPVFKKALVREYHGHESSVLDLSWSKNNFLLSSSMDKTVRLWHVSRDECLCTFGHTDFVTSIQFHPRDDRFFLAGSLDNQLRLWSIPDKHVAFNARVPDMVTAVAFTPDGKHSIAGCYNGLCLIYETDKLSLHAQIHVRSARGKNAKGSKITGIETMTLQQQEGKGETKILITSNDSRVRLYNLRDRQLEVKFRGNENTCSQIHATFSDDGRYVICGSEDRKVYIWPVEIQDKEQEKRPVHVFDAHAAIVTTAIMAPTKTRQLLGKSGDPIYDLVNPPPVVLGDPTEESIHNSSRAPTESGRSVLSHPESDARGAESPKKPEATHSEGNIIITADYTGAIKVFRQDNAHETRQQKNWDAQSGFSKKLLGRSASVATRTSISSNHRNSISRTSIILNKTNPANDRILNWRNSITGNHTASRETLRSRVSENGQTRSVSPGKAIDPRTSSHQASSAQSNGANAATVARTSSSHSMPHRASAPSSQPQSPSVEPPQTSIYSPVVHEQNDPLWVVGTGQSMRAWDTSNIERMANNTPRTPGFLSPDDANPLDRKQSTVSQLSSEGGSSFVNGGSAEGSQADPDEEVCSNCGGKEFRIAVQRTAKKDKDGGGGMRAGETRKLVCSKCGAPV